MENYGHVNTRQMPIYPIRNQVGHLNTETQIETLSATVWRPVESSTFVIDA